LTPLVACLRPNHIRKYVRANEPRGRSRRKREREREREREGEIERGVAMLQKEKREE